MLVALGGLFTKQTRDLLQRVLEVSDFANVGFGHRREPVPGKRMRAVAYPL